MYRYHNNKTTSKPYNAMCKKKIMVIFLRPELFPTFHHTAFCLLFLYITNIISTKRFYFQLVTISAFLVLVVPRARILGEAVAQMAVMIAMYHLYCMMIAECGGPENLVR